MVINLISVNLVIPRVVITYTLNPELPPPCVIHAGWRRISLAVSSERENHIEALNTYKYEPIIPEGFSIQLYQNIPPEPVRF